MESIKPNNLFLFLYLVPSTKSLELNRRRRLRGGVVHDGADAVDLVDDARRDLGQQVHVELVGLGRHVVRRDHGAEDDDVALDAVVALCLALAKR